MSGTTAETTATTFCDGMREFLGHLLYSERPGREERFAGDHQLLGLLFDAQQRHADGGPLLTLRDLPRDIVQAAVNKVETERFPTWRLAGDETDDVFDRLDAHFAPQIDAAARYRQERDAQLDRIGRASAELDQHLAPAIEREQRALWGLPVD